MLRALSCLRPRGSGKLVWAEAEEQQAAVFKEARV